MKNCEEIDKIIENLGGKEEYYCATLTDGSRIIFYINCEQKNFNSFLLSCCALTSEAILSNCESFSQDFLILHPEDITKIDYLDWCQLEDLITDQDSEFIFVDDDNWEEIEGSLIDFLIDGGTICFKGDPFKTFGCKRSIDHPTVATTTKVANVTELPSIEGSPVESQQCVQVNSSISGRKRKLF